jgi:zinc protease
MSHVSNITPSAMEMAYPVHQYQLGNGLKILIMEDHSIPSVALYLFFRVGSRNERPGITGLSHFLEHMMFNGARRYGPKRFDQVMEAAGGRNNAYTSRNVTCYQDWFPSNSLELVLDLEADRMAHLAMDPVVFETERDVVASERRMTTENDNLGLLEEQLWAAAYTAHPHQWPIIGWMVDIQSWQLTDLREFFRTYYAPNNVLLVLAGDIQSKTAMGLVDKYFGSLPSQQMPRSVTTREPEQPGERRVQVKKAAQLPAVMMSWHVPGSDHSDFYALQLLRTLALQGQSSRLYSRLVDRSQLATSVGGGFELSFDPTLFYLTIRMRRDTETTIAESAVLEELQRLHSEEVCDAEMDKARNILVAGFYRGMKTVSGRAGSLGNFEWFFGDYRKMFEIAERYNQVSAADVQRVARRYFHDKNRTVATLVPEN